MLKLIRAPVRDMHWFSTCSIFIAVQAWLASYRRRSTTSVCKYEDSVNLTMSELAACSQLNEWEAGTDLSSVLHKPGTCR